MGRFFVPFKSRTPADQVREALDRAEKDIVSLRRTGPNALEILHSFDFAASLLAGIKDDGGDIRAEQTRLDSILGMFRRKQDLFLREVGGALAEERDSVKPGRERWWWFINEIVVEQRKGRVSHLLKTVLIVGAVLLVAGFAYDRFLAPPENVREGLRYVASGESLVDQGDLPSALAQFEAAAAVTPDDVGAWIWIGVIHSEMGAAAHADDAFSKARALADSEVMFLLKRGQTYLRVGDTDPAMKDVDEALAKDPASGWGYVLRGNIYVQTGDFNAALADLDKAADLANASGDVQLEAYARTQRAMIMQQSLVPQLPVATPTPS